MDKHSESTANTYDIISGDISKESQVLGNVEISKKGQTKDMYVLVYVDTFSDRKLCLICMYVNVHSYNLFLVDDIWLKTFFLRYN